MKNYSINRKARGKRFQRKPLLLPTNLIQQILVILKEPDANFISKCKHLFPNGNVVTLFPRDEKEDQTTMGSYSYHSKDFNLTGVLKNDKLKSLIKTEFNLVLDLSDESSVNRYLIEHLNQSFMIGRASQGKDSYYDLIIRDETTENTFLDAVEQHIKLLTQE